MSLRISFELDDDDLNHFRLIMLEARKSAGQKSPEAIVAASEKLMQEIGGQSAPGFIVERLQKLRMMMRMISDIDWRLPHEDAKRVLNALAYFAEPDDLIPDEIPGLGFLDDAIMVELVVRELRHEIEAYADFCEYRDRKVKGSRVQLMTRRDELQSRMRRRRESSQQKNRENVAFLLD